MKSIDNLQWRYATKKFDSQKSLTVDQIEILVQAFNLTATSYGLQPCRLIIVQNQAIKNAMVEKAFGQRQVAEASAVLILCTKNVDVNYVNEYFELVKKIRSTPEEVLEPFKKQLTHSFSQKRKEEVEQWAKNQAYIALGNLMTVCAQERIDSCPMEGFLPKQIDELLGLQKQGLKSVLLLPVGHRAHDDMFSKMEKVRRPQQEMVQYV
ncbi:NAD(P)H-dependent oxidoreductase [Nonlabens arenilitoris]|uniref:NAD(P)H-dependent oxidoreductase n=1 Tax=Nonlabens arenilitoris TaxID=1217969 RepID=A0A2S7U6H7_9FLAO|nr:NAD(P)H-dependent oxidoreductase [Nonlabens arenilitoris]PQJ30609.1 NAD(P)H-dependent oxidoreductase [Nonlabens arenilitoris]